MLRDTPAWERHALTVFARRYSEVDERLGLVLGQAVPNELTVVSPEAYRFVAENVRYNPRWQEGRTMPLLLPVNATPLLHMGAK